MADDSASSKGVSRGGNGAVGSGSTKTSKGSVSNSSTKQSGGGKMGAGSSQSGGVSKGPGASGGSGAGRQGGGGGKMGAGSSQSGGVSKNNNPSGSKQTGGNTNRGDLGVAGVPGGVNRTGGKQAPAASKPSGGNAASRGDLGIAGVPGGPSRTGGKQATKAPAGNAGGGVSGIANAGKKPSAFGGFQGPGVNNLNSPTLTAGRVPPNTLGPRAASDQYRVSPDAGLGSYVKDQSRVPSGTNSYGATPDQYSDLNRGVGALTQQVSAPVNQGPGVNSLNAPVNSAPPGAFGGFNPSSPVQQQAIDRGLLGSVKLREQERASLTVGANSPVADPSNQFGVNDQYNVLSGPRPPARNPMANSYNPLSSVRTPASIAEQQDIASIYGDPTLGNIPTPTGRAFNTSEPVPTAASQYAGYGTFNVPVTPANQQVPQTAKVSAPPTQPVQQAYDPLSSFNRYVAPTVAALDGKIQDRVPLSGPEGPNLANVQGSVESYPTPLDQREQRLTLPGEAPYTNLADKVSFPSGNVTFSGKVLDRLAPETTQVAQYQNITPADPTSRPYDIRTEPAYNPLSSFNAPLGPFPDAPGARVTNVFNAGNLADLQQSLADQIVTTGGTIAASRLPRETVPSAPDTYDVTDPSFNLPDPAPPTNQYIGPTYPGFDIPDPGGRGNQIALPGGNNRQVVPVSGPPPTPTPPTPPSGGGGGTNQPPAPVNPFNPAYNNPAYNTVVQLPPLTQIAPISQGMGSLLPNIVVIDPFTGQPVVR